jgi:hypothetical protein
MHPSAEVAAGRCSKENPSRASHRGQVRFWGLNKVARADRLRASVTETGVHWKCVAQGFGTVSESFTSK